MRIGAALGRLAAIAAVIASGCTGSAPPFANAQRIGALSDAVGGPHAIGQIGDFLLENDQIRLVIADKGPGRVNTTFGGTLVDADLRRPGGGAGRGNDQLAELLPGFVFTVIDATNVEILRDGSDGGPAEVRVTGTGGDLLQMVALLNTGLINAPNLSMTQIYRLKPGQRWVEIETTIKNTTTGAHPFPYLNPAELSDLVGRNIPGLENLELSVPMGQLPLLGGEQDLFAPGRAGFNVQFAIEDTYQIAGGFPAFPGMAVDFLASRGVGVSYGLTIPKSPNNYVNAYAAGYPGQELTPYSMLLPFTYAGVAGVYMYKPPAQLGPGEQFTYTSYFVVGDGDVASVADAIYALRGEPTGTFGGRVVDAQTGAPVARANVMVLDGAGRPVNQIETEADGSFAAKLPPGDYGYVVVADDRLTTERTSFSLAAGGHAGVHVAMQPPATLVVSALDELGRRAPAKIQLLGAFDQAHAGKDPRSFLYSLPLGEARRPTAFDGGTRYIERAWWTKDGQLQAQVRPGTYDLVVSRGPEYELTTRRIELRPGAFT
ncbi:MAG: carboxypeptidase regulatory-like domain-containing protein, partial [Kofleriaceae bacterium]